MWVQRRAQAHPPHPTTVTGQKMMDVHVVSPDEKSLEAQELHELEMAYWQREQWDNVSNETLAQHS